MSITNLTQGTNGFLSLLGFSQWDVGTCSFTIPDPNAALNTKSAGNNGSIQSLSKGKSSTITFLDMGGVLSQLGISPNLSALPIAQSLIDGINNPASLPFANFFTGADSKGRTYLVKQGDKFVNQIMVYNRPASKPVLQWWGNEISTFQVVTVLAGDEYLTKLRYLTQILSSDIGENGGKLSHPLYGTFENVFVKEVDVASSASPFNASIVTITFITANTTTSPTKQGVLSGFKKFLSTVNKLISEATKVLNIISTLSNIQDQLKLLYPSTYFPSDKSEYQNIPYDIIKVNKPDNNTLQGVAINLKTIDPALSNAISILSENNIPLDYDVVTNAQKIIEGCCQFANIIAQGYGQGGLAETSTNTLVTSYPSAYTNTTLTFPNGVEVTISYQITTQNEDGAYNVLKTTTTITPVNTPSTEIYITNQINNLVIAASAFTSLYPDNYTDFTNLISYLEQLAYNCFRYGSFDKFTLPSRMTPAQVAYVVGMETSDLFALNTNLVGNKILEKGMSLNVYTEGVSK